MGPGRRSKKQANIQYPTGNIQRPSAAAHKSRIQANIQYPNQKKGEGFESRIQNLADLGLAPIQIAIGIGIDIDFSRSQLKTQPQKLLKRSE